MNLLSADGTLIALNAGFTKNMLIADFYDGVIEKIHANRADETF